MAVAPRTVRFIRRGFRVVAVVVVLAFAVGTAAFASPSVPGADLDCSGQTGLGDAQLMAHVIAGSDGSSCLPDGGTDACDVVDVAGCGRDDVNLVLRCLVGAVDQGCVSLSIGPCTGTIDDRIFGGDFVAAEITVTDESGGRRGAELFAAAVLDPQARFEPIAAHVAQLLYTESADVPAFHHIDVRVVDDPDAVASNASSGGVMVIRIGAQFLEGIHAGRGMAGLVAEIDGVMYHEIVHGYQAAPVLSFFAQGGFGFIEGMADAVRIAAGHHRFAAPNVASSDRWLAGYTTTGNFLHYYVTQVDNQFLRRFNATATEMGLGWGFDAAFEAAAGVAVESAWHDYVAFVESGTRLDNDGDYPWNQRCR